MPQRKSRITKRVFVGTGAVLATAAGLGIGGLEVQKTRAEWANSQVQKLALEQGIQKQVEKRRQEIWNHKTGNLSEAELKKFRTFFKSHFMTAPAVENQLLREIRAGKIKPLKPQALRSQKPVQKPTPTRIVPKQGSKYSKARPRASLSRRNA